MSLAFYGAHADEEHWSEHWQHQRFESLLAIARDTYLTRRLVEFLPAGGLVLEAGCGVGQYVLCLRERGWSVIGGDFSQAALAIGKAYNAPLPLMAMDVRTLPLPDNSLSAYVSLGVVEHFEAGPQPVLAEAYRVLTLGGRLLLSVPWINLMRWVRIGKLRALSERQRAAGAPFYQYAFSMREVRTFLESAGFRVQRFFPYDPGRGARGWLGMRGPAGSDTPGAVLRDRQAWPCRFLRALLYSPPGLAAFAHMVLAVAVKPVLE
jgi:SAM-dependent methyltransferase